MKINLLIILLLITSSSFGQMAKVGISNYSQDSLRVSIHDIISNPVVKIYGSDNAEIISYDLSLNINGVIYNWQNLNNGTLDDKTIQKLLQVENDKPRYNQLFIERVKHIDSDGKEQKSKGLFLWLANISTY